MFYNMLTLKLHDSDKKNIFNDLMIIVKECQTRYGGKTELATESDQKIIQLCESWETTLSHGLRSNLSVLKNVTDLVSGNVIEPPTFWEFAYHHLTTHEKERFSTLRHVWTDRGKGRALIRAALNERALERYMLIWLGDVDLEKHYDSYAIVRDPEVSHLLPSMAAGLSAILFAITVDSPELNAPPKLRTIRPEPVIDAPIPAKPIKKVATVKRQIISFDDNNSTTSTSSSAGLVCGSAPKSLSSLCLKYEEKNSDTNIVKPKIQPLEKHVTIGDVEIENIETISVTGQPETPSSIHVMFSFSENQQLSDSSMALTPPSDSGVVEEASEDSINSSLPSQNSSLRGSTSSGLSENDVAQLKFKLAEVEERCAWLEARVAELSLENHRLRSINNSSSRNHINYFTVSVPKVLLQRPTTKKFYAYEIHIIPTHGGDEWTVLRRYSEFYRLHKKYQKDNIGVKTLDFPPKKKFGNMDAHFVEQRRQRLQVYLRHLITILPEVSSCTTKTQLENTFPFLKC